MQWLVPEISHCFRDLQNLDGALRRAVLEQRTAYVEERFRDALRIDGAPPRCDRTGVTLHEPEACLVAYEKPGMFATLRYDWLVNEGISATEVWIGSQG